MTNLEPKIVRIARVAQAFTPHAPIDSLALFAGRITQAQQVSSAVLQRGYHVGLYGQRGVGKTSLASVLAELFSAPDLPSTQGVLVTCNTESTFESVWRDIFRELGLDPPAEITPENVRHAIAQLVPPAIIVIDELDRLADDDSLTLMADTIKAFSDHRVPSTIVLVGVASSLTGLVGEHESIVRNLAQIEMPRMSPRELVEILQTGCHHAGLTIRDDAMARIVMLSEGLPHYTHLLALACGERVVENDRTEITLADVDASIERAVTSHTLRDTYLRAVRSPRSDSLYRQVLLACALAPKDRLGYFTAGSIREPLRVMGRPLDIPAFARHMAAFQAPERGSVLQREGEPRNYHYRFADPILQQFVVLDGLAEGLITEEQLEQLRPSDIDDMPGASPPPAPNEPPRLFD